LNQHGAEANHEDQIPSAARAGPRRRRRDCGARVRADVRLRRRPLSGCGLRTRDRTACVRHGLPRGARGGRNDARRGRDYAPSRHGEYRDADDGYHRRDGEREFYRRVYRRGFEVGYRESFDRNQRYRDYRR